MDIERETTGNVRVFPLTSVARVREAGAYDRGVSSVATRGRSAASPVRVRPKCGESGPLLSHHLHRDLTAPGPVELGEDDRLEASERELTVAEPDRDVAAEQCGP